MSGHAPPVEGARFGDDWWRRGVIYQVYPRSFADSNGDGVGDLAGIINHLDDLGPDGLGVDAIWLSPIYPSPGLDGGYDVADHERVDPVFGSEREFDRLVAETHRRGIRIVLDLVMNHTSDAHPWFASSRVSRDGPHADWYLWSNPSGIGEDDEPLPPNNWLSFFGGPGWEWEPRRGQFYYHTFLVEQPEVNWRNAGLEEAQLRMVRGWLARGVDGFRLDVFNLFLKHPDLPSDPIRPGGTGWDSLEHLYDRDQPDFPALIGRFRAILDEEPGRMSVGELFGGDAKESAGLTSGAHLVFDWTLLDAAWTASAIRSALETRQAAFGDERWPTVVLSNHDRPRHASRLAASVGALDPGGARDPAGSPNPDAVARAAAVLLLTVRGTPFLYYGEEIGMRDVEVPPDESVDPPAFRFGAESHSWDRSACRTPMPWSPGPGSGFTEGRPWLRFAPDVEVRNVEVQRGDPGSILSTYRRLLALRAATPALQVGSLRVHPTESNVVAYTREVPGQRILVLLNPGREDAGWDLPGTREEPGWRLVFDTAPTSRDALSTAGASLVLAPDEALILEAVR